MFGKKNEKLEALKELLGSREAYMESVQMLELEGEEKEIFLRASVELKKKKPNLEIIDKAYDVLVSKSFKGEAGESNNTEVENEPSISKIPPFKSKDNTINFKKMIKSIAIIFAVLFVSFAVYKVAPMVGSLSEEPAEIILKKRTVERAGLYYKVNSQEPFTGIIEEYYKDGQKKEEESYKDGIPNGKVVKYYESGQKKYEGGIKYESLAGKITKWYKNGQKEYEKNYKNGGLHGKVIEWSRNGQKEYEKNYKNGVLDGRFIKWFRDGLASSEANILNGVDSKIYTSTAYYEDGKKRLQIGYKSSSSKKAEEWYESNKYQDGKIIEWYRNGQKKIEGNFKDDQPYGKFVAWDESGKIIAEADVNVTTADGRGVIGFYGNELIKSIINTKNNQANGKFIRWYKNGKIQFEGTFKNGKIDELTGWDEKGRIQSEVVYRNDVKIGKATEWHINGEKKECSECRYFEHCTIRLVYPDDASHGFCKECFKEIKMELEKCK